MVLKYENDFEISEFYPSRTFSKSRNMMRFFEILKFSENDSGRGLLPFEFPERKLG